MTAQCTATATTTSGSDYDESIIKLWNELSYKPTAVVFDLDYTLWPFLIDQDLVPPLKKKLVNKTCVILDHNNKSITHFQDVTRIIKTLKEVCFAQSNTKHYLAIASKATVKELALKLIDMFNWTQYFDSFQIHAGVKTIHMKTIAQELKLKSFDQILFFDDTRMNVKQTEELGIYLRVFC